MPPILDFPGLLLQPGDEPSRVELTPASDPERPGWWVLRITNVRASSVTRGPLSLLLELVKRDLVEGWAAARQVEAAQVAVDVARAALRGDQVVTGGPPSTAPAQWSEPVTLKELAYYYRVKRRVMKKMLATGEPRHKQRSRVRLIVDINTVDDKIARERLLKISRERLLKISRG